MAEGTSKNNNSNVMKNSSFGSDDTKDDDPRLLEDSNPWDLPRHVKVAREDAYSKLSRGSDSSQPSTTTPVDILVALAYSLMLESGFVPANKVHEAAYSRGYHHANVRQYSSLPETWREHGCYMMRLALPASPYNPVRLIGVPCSETLILTVADVASGSGYSICLDPTRYVSRRSIPITGMMELRNIRELSFKIKNGLCTPMRCAVLQRIGVENPSLVGLPRELITIILTLLPARELAMLAASCKYMSVVASDEFIWLNLFQRDFSSYAIDARVGYDWRYYYGSTHKNEANRRRRRERDATLHGESTS